MNNIQKLECKIINYAQTISGLLIISDRDYRQLRKGLRLTYRILGNGLSYYDWLCKERMIWAGIKLSRKMQELSTLAEEIDA